MSPSSRCPCPVPLVEAAAPEVVGDDDVCDGVEDELDVLRVGGARHVAVDLLRRRLVLRLELRLDVRRRLAVLLRTCGREKRGAISDSRGCLWQCLFMLIMNYLLAAQPWILLCNSQNPIPAFYRLCTVSTCTIAMR